MSLSHAALNEIGMRISRRGCGRRMKGARETTPEERAIRDAFERRILDETCCVSSFQVAAVTTNEVVALLAGKIWECPIKCAAYRAIFEDPPPFPLRTRRFSRVRPARS